MYTCSYLHPTTKRWFTITFTFPPSLDSVLYCPMIVTHVFPPVGVVYVIFNVLFFCGIYTCTCTCMYMYLHVYYICTWSVCTCIIHVHEMYDLIFLYACLVTTTLDTSVAHSLALSVHAAKALVVAVVFVCIRLHFGSNYSVRCVSKVYLTWPEPSIICYNFIIFHLF